MVITYYVYFLYFCPFYQNTSFDKHLENTMSNNVDKIFRLILILASLCLLKNTKIFFKIRITFLILVWWVFLSRIVESNSTMDFYMFLFEKTNSGLSISLTFINGHLTSRHLGCIKSLIKQNSFSNTKITSNFIPIFFLLAVGYSIESALSLDFNINTEWFSYTYDQYAMMTYIDFVNVVMVSMIYSIGHFIHQQYKQLNNKLNCNFIKRDEFNRIARIYTVVHEQNESFKAGFGLFLLGKFLSTYCYVIISLYYLITATEDFAWYSNYTLALSGSELAMILYCCGQIQQEV